MSAACMPGLSSKLTCPYCVLLTDRPPEAKALLGCEQVDASLGLLLFIGRESMELQESL